MQCARGCTLEIITLLLLIRDAGVGLCVCFCHCHTSDPYYCNHHAARLVCFRSVRASCRERWTCATWCWRGRTRTRWWRRRSTSTSSRPTRSRRASRSCRSSTTQSATSSWRWGTSVCDSSCISCPSSKFVRGCHAVCNIVVWAQCWHKRKPAMLQTPKLAGLELLSDPNGRWSNKQFHWLFSF